MLSNTAVPKYYGEFRRRVLRGEIPVNKEISLQMNRIDRRIEDPRYYYDDKIVDGWIKYCENELTLTDGSDLNLTDSFKLWGEDVFGWYYFVEREVFKPGKNGAPGRHVTRRIKKRLTNRQYLIVGRSAAKSLYNTCVLSYFENIDNTAKELCAIAPTMRQAEEILAPYRTALLRSRGPYFQFMTAGNLLNTSGSKATKQMLAPTKKGIENFLNGSKLETRPMSIDKIQGSRARYFSIDEWLSCTIREDPVNAAEQGAAKHDDYLLLCTSSEGTVRNGVGDTIKMTLTDILTDEYQNDHVSIWWYKLDDISEISDPNMWLKANPNLGITVQYETYEDEVLKAEKDPSQRNDILAKRFGIPMEGFTYFFAYEQTIPHHYRNYDGMSCSLGGDLSQGNDFCAFTFLFPLKDGCLGIKTRSYITQLTLDKLPSAMYNLYQTFIKEGSLVIMNDTVLDVDKVYEDLDTFITEHDYDVTAFGYDPYNAKPFVERFEHDYGGYGIVKVIQGKKTETVPLGELHIYAEQRMLLFDQEIMKYTMGNCIVERDINNQMMLMKRRYEQKIDNVSAMMDAYVAYVNNKEMFE